MAVGADDISDLYLTSGLFIHPVQLRHLTNRTAFDHDPKGTHVLAVHERNSHGWASSKLKMKNHEPYLFFSTNRSNAVAIQPLCFRARVSYRRLRILLRLKGAAQAKPLYCRPTSLSLVSVISRLRQTRVTLFGCPLPRATQKYRHAFNWLIWNRETWPPYRLIGTSWFKHASDKLMSSSSQLLQSPYTTEFNRMEAKGEK